MILSYSCIIKSSVKQIEISFEYIYIRYQWNSHSVVKKLFLWSAQLYLDYTELEISTGHWTKSDIKTAMSDTKSPCA